jgi:hypothetical protein
VAVTECLGCELIGVDGRQVTLHDGTVVCNQCEQWRMECEARHLLNMPLGPRRKALDAISEKRGPKVLGPLKNRMEALWRGRRGIGGG